MSAASMNKLLAQCGLQHHVTYKPGKKCWAVTPDGKECAVITDTGKKHRDGKPVQRNLWKESVAKPLKRVAEKMQAKRRRSSRTACRGNRSIKSELRLRGVLVFVAGQGGLVIFLCHLQRSCKMRRIIGLMVIAASISGCATSFMDYRPPSGSPIANTKKVPKDFDKAWDDLVRQLSADFFVINNIDKSSRLINVSFSSSRPSEFIDCGSTTRRFSNAHGEQVYNYLSADSSQFAVVNDQHIAFNATRSTKLEGRVNVYVAPTQDGTDISVNTKYVFTVDFKAVGLDGRPGGTQSSTFDFSTKSPHSSPELTCFAKGTLESKILDMVM